MDVHDEHIPEETFADCLARLPQACVDLVVERDGAALLARRTNAPARGEWFWPGSRLFKGERLDDAVDRIAREELGIDVELVDQIGAYGHFWDDTSVDGLDTRHTLTVAYHVRPVDPDPAVALDDQHDGYRWVADPEGCHEYVRLYFRECDALG